MRLEELDLTEDKMSVTGVEAEELDETDDTPEADAAYESLSMDSPKTNTTIEEKPVVGRGKTFEPFLEEKLAEDQRQQTSSKSPATSKPFLKKFSGLSRFNIKSSEPSNKTKSSPFCSGSTPVRKVTPIKDKKSGSKLLESNAKNQILEGCEHRLASEDAQTKSSEASSCACAVIPPERQHGKQLLRQAGAPGKPPAEGPGRACRVQDARDCGG